MHIVTLTTCHNRKEKTLSALRDLHEQDLPANVTLTHVLVDDGSSDGTAEAVRSAFPDVHVVEGTGNLYWAGGMRYGWKNAVKDMNFDALLVYNDDVRLENSAISQLISISHVVRDEYGALHAISGAFSDKNETVCTYGGFVRASRWHPLRFKHVAPTGAKQKVDTVNMNCCLITKEALGKVGFLAEYFKHAGADLEFGLRLCKSGGSVWLTPGTVGICERNGVKGTSQENCITQLERWRRLIGIKEQPPMQRMNYFRNHGGWCWPFLWAGPYLRVGMMVLLKPGRSKEDKGSWRK